ncbi:MAG: PEGA domain-containing protein, partial [Deltaproteobacteria bacterium]|nr:PEGA domain-containing protein [Deltaproteobacteria bacterium]
MKKKKIFCLLLITAFAAVSKPEERADAQVAQVKDIRKIYVVDLTGDISAKMGDILASEIRTAILKNLKIEVFTYKNLSDQLKVEQQKEILRCESDQMCIEEVISGFGISAKLFGDCKKLPDGTFYVDISLTDKGKMIASTSRQTKCADEKCLVKEVGIIALDLFKDGKKGEISIEKSEKPAEITVKGDEKVVKTGGGAWEPAEDALFILEVKTEPEGGMAAIDDGAPKKTPFKELLPAGRYNITASKEMYKTSKESVTLNNNGTIVIKLEPSFGTIAVKSKPDGSDVLVNGEFAGKTPFEKTYPAGYYKVVIKKEMYLGYEKTFTLKSGTREVVEKQLEENFGVIEAKTTPPGAEVKADGKTLGKTPLAGIELPPGVYDVEVSLDGYYPYMIKGMNLERGKTRKIEETLEPMMGALKVLS